MQNSTAKRHQTKDWRRIIPRAVAATEKPRPSLLLKKWSRAHKRMTGQAPDLRVIRGGRHA